MFLFLDGVVASEPKRNHLTRHIVITGRNLDWTIFIFFLARNKKHWSTTRYLYAIPLTQRQRTNRIFTFVCPIPNWHHLNVWVSLLFRQIYSYIFHLWRLATFKCRMVSGCVNKNTTWPCLRRNGYDYKHPRYFGGQSIPLFQNNWSKKDIQNP